MIDYILGLDAFVVFDIFLATFTYFLFTGSALGYYFEYHRKTIYTELGLESHFNKVKKKKTEKFRKLARKYLNTQR